MLPEKRIDDVGKFAIFMASVGRFNIFRNKE